ncbi:MAG TPA: ABC transporter ATP-binding protein [Actinomycetota bacterium]|nr:ABC transporter ATP-binding protein [Actinomycetota bacterium]
MSSSRVAAPAPVIRCEGLSKRFGATLAVDGLDLEVGPGQVYGFLGPNGAGKTTTIRMLLGLVAPSGGRAWVEGRELPDASVAAMVGSMIEEPAFYPWMTGRANLELFGAISRRADRATVAEALGWAGADSFADRKVKTYSQGMRQRIGLADALMGRPRLLVLDEPTNGLDPAGIREFRELLRGFAADGGTVFVSSHLLAEVEHVCDRAAVIVRGRLVEEGPVATLGAAGRKVRVEVLPPDLTAAQDALARWLVAVDGTTLLVGHGSGREVNAALVGAGVVAESIEVVKPSLEERFLSLTNGSAPAPDAAGSDGGGGVRAAGR